MRKYSLLVGLVFGILFFSFAQNVPFASATELGSIVDTLEFDGDDGITPNVINIGGDYFAVVYEGTSDDGKISTFTIDNAGQIGNTLTDGPDTFDAGVVSNPKIFHVTGTTYAVVYEENGSIKFDTFTISSTGVMTPITPTTFTIATASDPDVVRLSGGVGATQFYALAYTTSGGAGNVATFSVTANGDTITQVTAGTQFTATARDIEIIKIANAQKYAAAYTDTTDKGQVEIITITDNGDTITPGDITLALNSNSAISSTSKLDFAHVTGTLYAVLWADTIDTKIQTITIPDNGASITNVAVSGAIDPSGVPTDPVFLQTDVGVNPLNFVIAYHDTTAIKGELRTVTISTDGATITNVDNIKFENTSPAGQSPSLVHRTGDFYAVAYRGVGADGFVVSFNLGSGDSTAPSTTGARTITEVGDANTNDFSKLNDQVRLTFTASETIQTPVVTFPTLNNPTITYVNTEGNTWTATATIPSTATAGLVTFTLNFEDLAGNDATEVTTVSDGSSVTVDLTAPTTVATLIVGESGSLNGDTDYSRVNDGAGTSLTANEPLASATITIGQETNTAMASGGAPTAGPWTDTYTLQAGDTENTSGSFPFTITATDRAGNQGTITQALITDGSRVVFDKTAPTFVSGAIVGNGDLNIRFSEPVLSAAGDYVVEWPDDTVVAKTLSGSGSKTILLDTVAVDAEGDDAVDFSISAATTDRAGNALSPTVALANPRIASTPFVQPTLTSTTNQVALSDNTLITSITSTATDPELNLSALTGGFPAALTLTTANSNILFPSGTTPGGLPASGVIGVSVSTKTASTAILPAGQVAGTIIEIGDPDDDTITFTTPVRVTLTGQAGNTPFIVTNTQTVLVDDCTTGSATVAPTLTSTDPTNAASHCAIDAGSDLIIWTRHFTGFGSSSTPSSSGGGGSGGGDSSPPSISVGFEPNEFPLKYNGVNYKFDQLDTAHTAIIGTGEELRVTLMVSDNEGAGSVQHVELYLNQFGTRILNDLTETIVIYDEQSGLEIIDPHDLIATANVIPSVSGNKAVFDFMVVLKDEIPQSDVLFRLWDIKRNSMLIHLPDALIVEISEQSSNIISADPESGISDTDPESGISDTDPESGISDTEPESLIPETTPEISEQIPDDTVPPKTWTSGQLSVLKEWGGFATESASDIDVLSKFGIKGEKIPSFVKQYVKWILDDNVTQEEFVNALQHFKKQGLLSNSVGPQTFEIPNQNELEEFTLEKESIDNTMKFNENKNELYTKADMSNLEDKIKTLRALANNVAIQNELVKSNLEFEILDNPTELINQRDVDWKRNAKNITPFMESLMNTPSALISKAIIEHDTEDLVPIINIVITNAYGVNSAITEKTPDYLQSDEEWWSDTKENGVNIMSGTGSEERTGLNTSEISISVNDSEGNFIGIIKAVVNFDKAFLSE